MRKLLLIFLILTATGCVAWTKTAGIHKSTNLGFTVAMPDGWMKLTQTNAVLLSKDGVLLQNILIRRDAIDKILEFTLKRFVSKMLPQEAAEVYLDNERLNSSKFNFTLLQNLPAEISGRPGFNVEYAYKTKDGLAVRTASHGLVTDDYVYQITYTAAKRYYYGRDVSTYLELVKSFQLNPK